jgi:hypothetical protein
MSKFNILRRRKSRLGLELGREKKKIYILKPDTRDTI